MVASNNIKLLDNVDREQVIVDGGSSRTGQVESTKRLLQQLDTSLGERVVVRLEVLRHLGIGWDQREMVGAVGVGAKK